jgi:hypothetical protein
MRGSVAEEVNGVAPPVERRRQLRYLAILLLIPLVFYPLPFFLATSANYEHWATSTWTPMLEYAFTAHVNADVVIFGDSSAFIGIDPRLIDASLGVKSVVLPDSVGSIPVTGDLPLKSYLAHNRPPKLLVLYFSPWDMDFSQIARFRQFEGQEMLLRHGSWRAILSFAVHQPTELLAFPFRLYSTFGPKMIKAILHHVDRERDVERALGHAEYKEGFAPLKPDCQIPEEYLQKTGVGSVQELKKRYSTPETQVLVYVAPIPACGNSDVETGRSFAEVGAGPPRTLPVAMFAGDPYYAHVLPEYVSDSTAQFVEALRGRLKQTGAAAGNADSLRE